MRIGLLIIAFAALIINGEKPKPKTDAYKGKPAHTVKQTDEASSRTVIVVNQPAPEGKENNHAKESASYLCRLFSPENLPTIALVIVGLIGIGLALRTVKATETTAKAALLNAKALIKSERAWVMVDIEWQHGVSKVINFDSAIGSSIRVKCICKNEGNAPAWVLQKRCWLTFVNQIPEVPDFRFMDIFDREPQSLAKNQFTEYKLNPASNGQSCPTNTLIFYGFVTYKDTFGVDRETRFGYIVTKIGGLSRIPDRPQYNQHT